MEYSGAGWKLIHEKNQKQKISWHSPFKVGTQSFILASKSKIRKLLQLRKVR